MKMLSSSATKYIGCCARCARGKPHRKRPAPMTRHQARAVEKRRWRREQAS